MPTYRTSARSFHSSGDWVFTNELTAFIEANSLAPFNLSQIRPAISEAVDLLTGGDLKAQQTVLNHWNSEITDQHYVSGEAKRRRIERLAEIQNRRERFISTSGRADPRNVSSANTGRAATPGFECLDPYQSPLASQSDGCLCDAWGECPICPLVAVNPHDPRALALLVRFDAAIDSAKTTLHPARWLHWAPIQAATRRLLTNFADQQVWTDARQIVLPPLLAIE